MNTLFDALTAGDDAVVRALRAGADPEGRSDEGETPLYAAAVHNRPGAVRLLLAAGADPGRASGEDSVDLPLCGAACGGHTEVVRALLAAGAAPDQEEEFGYTALAWAARLGHTEVARELLAAGADPGRPGPDGLDPLMAAARRGSSSLVRTLLEHGAGRDREAVARALAEARRWIGVDMAAELRRGLVQGRGGGAQDTYEAVVRRVPEDGGITVVVELLREDGAPGSGDERQTGHAAIATLLEGALGLPAVPEELAGRALRCGDPEQEDWTTAATALVERAGAPDVLAAAGAWCADPDPLRRAFGARVLGELAAGPGGAGDAVEVLRALAAGCARAYRSADPRALGAREPALSTVVALGRLADPAAVPELLELAGHPDPQVRQQVGAALAGLVPAGDTVATGVLVRLARDPVARVRDWATLALAELPDDTAVVRDALAARLADPDPETAAEAARGLAIRQDPRAIEVLAAILADGDAEGPARETALAALEHLADPRVRTRLEWTVPRGR
ncbi:ankyrin repeat domain-containing protein [Streptomyces sp. NPDC048717]|uniref:ankyrin repeat domain-containing protein n=1 Tax=Streptomyces sp. NPDC048717 TaxID=3154928 RepID=UPI0034290F30